MKNKELEEFKENTRRILKKIHLHNPDVDYLILCHIPYHKSTLAFSAGNDEYINYLALWQVNCMIHHGEYDDEKYDMALFNVYKRIEGRLKKSNRNINLKGNTLMEGFKDDYKSST